MVLDWVRFLEKFRGVFAKRASEELEVASFWDDISSIFEGRCVIFERGTDFSVKIFGICQVSNFFESGKIITPTSIT